MRGSTATQLQGCGGAGDSDSTQRGHCAIYAEDLVSSGHG
jgi:hypothetical protein